MTWETLKVIESLDDSVICQNCKQTCTQLSTELHVNGKPPLKSTVLTCRAPFQSTLFNHVLTGINVTNVTWTCADCRVFTRAFQNLTQNWLRLTNVPLLRSELYTLSRRTTTKAALRKSAITTFNNLMVTCSSTWKYVYMVDFLPTLNLIYSPDLMDSVMVNVKLKPILKYLIIATQQRRTCKQSLTDAMKMYSEYQTLLRVLDSHVALYSANRCVKTVQVRYLDIINAFLL